jgi:hypothetical protein
MVIMLKGVFWDVTSCGSCNHRRFGGTYRLHHQGEKDQRAEDNVSSNKQLKRAAKKHRRRILSSGKARGKETTRKTKTYVGR